MTGRERNDNDASPARGHDACTDDGFGRIISTLHDDVRAEGRDQFERRVLVEDHDGVHAFERGEKHGALILVSNRTRRPLEAAHRSVTVHAYDERVTGCTRGGEHIHVTGVQEIEYAVRERDLSVTRGAPAARGRNGEDFAAGVERLAQNGPEA